MTHQWLQTFEEKHCYCALKILCDLTFLIIMANTTTNVETDLGKLTLIQKETGQQIIQWEVPAGLSIDLSYLLKPASAVSESQKLSGLSTYFESVLSHLSDTTCYQRSRYSGLRCNKSGKTLVYWNENACAGYIHINCREQLIDPILAKTKMPWDVDNRFFGTKRIRLYSKQEIDLFVKELLCK